MNVFSPCMCSSYGKIRLREVTLRKRVRGDVEDFFVRNSFAISLQRHVRTWYAMCWTDKKRRALFRFYFLFFTEKKVGSGHGKLNYKRFACTRHGAGLACESVILSWKIITFDCKFFDIYVCGNDQFTNDTNFFLHIVGWHFVYVFY